MHRARRLVRLLVLVGVLGLAPVALAAGGASWGSAIAVPGAAALNLGGEAVVTSVSCASAGNCAAGGYYKDRPDCCGNYHRAFVADETDGVWGTAVEVPGMAALNLGVYAEVRKVSCGSAGNCAVIGFYEDGAKGAHPFVVDLTNGVWGTAVAVPGTAALHLSNDDLENFGVSCVGAGDCAASFGYYAASGKHQGFVLERKSGVWGTARRLPGDSISCASAGNCTAVGGASVADEKNGVWGKPHKVLSATPLPGADLTSVSCAGSGNCTAVGHYVGVDGHYRAFLVSESHGVWGTTRRVQVPASWYSAWVTSVSCAGAGGCAAVGGYTLIGQGAGYAFVMTKRHGVWSKAVAAPGLPAGAGPSSVGSVSCAFAGICVAAAWNAELSYNGFWVAHYHAYVLAETNGAWQRAREVPGIAALSPGDEGGATSISCTTAGPCVIGGWYADASSHAQQAFVTAP